MRSAPAGAERGFVSESIESGPSMPCRARYSQVSWGIAASQSLKAESSGGPWRAQVPKATCCTGSAGPGKRARATSFCGGRGGQHVQATTFGHYLNGRAYGGFALSSLYVRT